MAMNENEYPPVRPVIGRPLKNTPKQLMEKFIKYVEWCESHPTVIRSKKTIKTDSGRVRTEVSEERKPRLVCIEGFMIYLGTTHKYWSELDESKTDFSPVKGFIRAYCETYQKEKASSGEFNANIISRLLGLADKHEAVVDNRDSTVRELLRKVPGDLLEKVLESMESGQQ